MPFDTEVPLKFKNLGDEIMKNRINNQKLALGDAQLQRLQQPDFNRAVQDEVLKASRGMPYDQSVIDAYSALKGGQTYIDPTTQNIVVKPSLRDNLQNMGHGGNTLGSIMPQGQRLPERQLGTNTVGSLMAPDLPDDLASIDNNYASGGSALPPALPSPISPEQLQPTSSVPKITMDNLRTRVAPKVSVDGPLANTPRGTLMEAQANLELQKDLAKQDAKQSIDGKKFNESQSNAATYADRMAEADAILSTLSVAQTDPIQSTVKGVLGQRAGNYAVSPNFQRAEQAQDNYLNAVLRKESGASISPEERAVGKKQYFPQPGDSPEVIAQKAQNRKTALNGVARAAGEAYKPKTFKNLGMQIYFQDANGDWIEQ